MSQEDLRNDLQDIINICKDGAEGYETAANHVEDGELKTLFLRLSQQRKGYVEELKNEALRNGMELNANGTIKGFFHRNWLATKAAFSSNATDKVVEESMTGEKGALETYNEVLAKHELPDYLIETLENQRKFIAGALTDLNSIHAKVHPSDNH